MDVVRIFSFSIKHRTEFGFAPRLPNFSFDCRSIVNPGRFGNLMTQTGQDAEVIAFLDRDPGAARFSAGVQALLGAYVDSVRAKDYGDVLIGFSCTGGRHRSVYFAEKTAAALRARFNDAAIAVTHLDIASHYVPPTD